MYGERRTPSVGPHLRSHIACWVCRSDALFRTVFSRMESDVDLPLSRLVPQFRLHGERSQRRSSVASCQDASYPQFTSNSFKRFRALVDENTHEKPNRSKSKHRTKPGDVKTAKINPPPAPTPAALSTRVRQALYTFLLFRPRLFEHPTAGVVDRALWMRSWMRTCADEACGGAARGKGPAPATLHSIAGRARQVGW